MTLVCINIIGILSVLFSWQERRLEGIITSNQLRVSAAQILNVTHTARVVSNDLGEFVISASPGDTLIISKPGFVEDTVRVEDKPALVVTLHKRVIALREVTVVGQSLTPNSIFEKNKRDFKAIYHKGDIRNIVVVEGLGIRVSIDKLYNALSREGRQSRKLQKTFLESYRNSLIDERFNERLISTVTGYKGERLRSFMDQYRPSYELLFEMSDYELIEYIRKQMSTNRER